MFTKEIMTDAVISVAPDNSVRHAAQIMLDHHISGLPVMDSGGRLVGILTEGDLLRRAELGTPARTEGPQMSEDYIKIVVTCSTLGEAVDCIRPLSPVPLFRIDRGMAEEAVRKARRIGVLATLPTTLAPTTALIRDCARSANRDCEIVDLLCEGADGDLAGHNIRVVSGFENLAKSVDLIVLAQASMASTLDGYVTDIPYLTSPELGMAHVAHRLGAG